MQYRVTVIAIDNQLTLSVANKNCVLLINSPIYLNNLSHVRNFLNWAFGMLKVPNLHTRIIIIKTNCQLCSWVLEPRQANLPVQNVVFSIRKSEYWFFDLQVYYIDSSIVLSCCQDMLHGLDLVPTNWKDFACWSSYLKWTENIWGFKAVLKVYYIELFVANSQEIFLEKIVLQALYDSLLINLQRKNIEAFLFSLIVFLELLDINS